MMPTLAPSPLGTSLLSALDPAMPAPVSRPPSGLAVPPGGQQPHYQHHRSPSADGLLAPGSSRGHSPVGSLSGTPRPASGLGLGPGSAPEQAGLALAGDKGWSSLDGMPRPNWQDGGDSFMQLPPLQQQHLQPPQLQLPPMHQHQQQLYGGSALPPRHPPNSLGGMLGGMQQQGSLDSLQRPAHLQGLAPQGVYGQQQAPQQHGIGTLGQLGQQHALQQQMLQAQQAQHAQLLQAQQAQQLLQAQQMLQAQRAAGLPPSGYAAQQGGMNNLQAAQAAALRQQALLRNGMAGAGMQGGLGQGGGSNNALLLQQAIQAQQALMDQRQRGAVAAALAGRGGLSPAQQGQLNSQLNSMALAQQLQAGGLGGAGQRGGYGQINSQMSGLAGLNPALAAALLSANPAGLQALQAQQSSQAAAAAQQALLAQALRAQAAGGLRSGAPPHPQQAQQLQSEALMAMQRQQAALAAQGMRMQQGSGNLPAEQLAAMAQLSMLGKPASGAVRPGGLSGAQQAALLSALQGGAGGQQQQAQQAQQQHGGMNGAAAHHLLQQQSSRAMAGLPGAPGSSQPNLLAAALAGQRSGAGAAPREALGQPGRGTGDAPGSDPIQTLQDIGRTLAQLSISVEAAVNAGLLGGLSASDVRIVAEAHRQESDAPRAAAAVAAAATAAAAAAAQQGVPRPGSTATGSRSGGSESEFPLDSDGAPEAGGAQGPTAAVDEVAIRARLEADAAARFDAGQYGFFGDAGSEGGLEDGVDSGSAPPGGIERPRSADAVLAPGRGGSHEAWDTASLPGDLDRRSDPGSADGAPHPPQGHSQGAALWGASSQGNAADPFGCYLAGLRLGTGF